MQGMCSGSRAAFMRELCERWVQAAVGAGGGIQFGGQSESFRLHANGIRFHELEHGELQCASLGLMRVLLLPGFNTIIDKDHLLLWAWHAEFLLSREAGYLPIRERADMRQLLEMCIRCALARPSPRMVRSFEERRELSRLWEALVDVHFQHLGIHAHDLLAYVGFPLLEGVTKLALPTYVDLDGNVLQPFRVSLDPRPYGPSARRRCSNVAHLLDLLHQQADQHLKAALDTVRAHLKSFEPNQDPWLTLYEWRNSSLHGAGALRTIGGTVLTIALLIAVAQFRDKYRGLRDRIVAQLRQRARVFGPDMRRDPWTYYPSVT
jgi:hypothetical protein